MKRVVKALFMCLGMFTALPCPYRPWDEDARDMMLACLPIVGALLGLLWAVLTLLGRRLLPACAAALVAALPWLLTGSIHLDGYMDTCDAILSWRPLEQRLHILKDAHTGAFAVIGFGVLALFSYDASRSVAINGDVRVLLLIPIVSRCCSALSVMSLKPIGHSEYATLKGGSVQRLAVACMWLMSMLVCGVWLKGLVLVPALETLSYALATLWAYCVLKGVSGDVAGFALSIAECTALIALANASVLMGGTAL